MVPMLLRFGQPSSSGLGWMRDWFRELTRCLVSIGAHGGKVLPLCGVEERANEELFCGISREFGRTPE